MGYRHFQEFLGINGVVYLVGGLEPWNFMTFQRLGIR